MSDFSFMLNAKPDASRERAPSSCPDTGRAAGGERERTRAKPLRFQSALSLPHAQDAATVSTAAESAQPRVSSFQFEERGHALPAGVREAYSSAIQSIYAPRRERSFRSPVGTGSRAPSSKSVRGLSWQVSPEADTGKDRGFRRYEPVAPRSEPRADELMAAAHGCLRGVP